ncbi:MAG TPA: quinone-dependent dihydroorotate dehydrogenase [Burkholderiales bacterium]|nr:quinone-dependent dihydroorotate dehydrogenase [Burkholderiales bacterium]
MYRALRPLLFAMPPELAHHATLGALRAAGRSNVIRLLAPKVRQAPRRLLGLTFPNPVGLAAGLDKNGRYIDALAGLGFGFLEVGTVTPRPQPGNPPPRLFRLPAARAVINRMGFNNEGVDALVRNLREVTYQGILGINIGKNRDTPLECAADDYLQCLRKVHRHASYVTVNISSPNTPNLRQLQGAEALSHLLGQIAEERRRLADSEGRRVPMAVKLSPDLPESQVQQTADLLVRHGIDTVIVANTMVGKESVLGLRHGNETGGLSGAPLTALARTAIARFAKALAGAIPIIGAGGTMTGADAASSIRAGASLVQLYTGLVYAGPQLISECVDAIAAAQSGGSTEDRFPHRIAT